MTVFYTLAIFGCWAQLFCQARAERLESGTKGFFRLPGEVRYLSVTDASLGLYTVGSELSKIYFLQALKCEEEKVEIIYTSPCMRLGLVHKYLLKIFQTNTYMDVIRIPKKTQRVDKKNFHAEIRARRDVDLALSSSVVLLDLHAQGLDQIITAMLNAVVSAQPSSGLNIAMARSAIFTSGETREIETSECSIQIAPNDLVFGVFFVYSQSTTR
ncbi:sodium bicarbonate transporter-like protein 11 [Plakobranchus ocellatus]|uniref:Sodium bicarbonate transporter-like protein 11 n=1 Tax=Plakobranchus ocellatus TaxID=259542 RepID=A0AAV3Y9X0_9GAST|nr:sodium bicarbonate transporter-like protein 11 [Plakobranchus ocellatus]